MLARGPQQVLCLLDGGAQRSFIRKRLADKLRLQVLGHEYLGIQSFGTTAHSPPTLHGKRPITVCGMYPGAPQMDLVVYDKDQLTIAPRYVHSRFAKGLSDSGRHLADTRFFDSESPEQEVDILIGADYIWRVLGDQHIRNPDGLTAIESIFGWILHGPNREEESASASTTHVMVMQSMLLPNLNQPDWRREIMTGPVANVDCMSANRITMLSAVERRDGWDESVDFDMRSFWKVEGQGTDEGDGRKDPDPLAN